MSFGEAEANVYSQYATDDQEKSTASTVGKPGD
jgi:hypothetical protein